jgi:LmbE family N-acetylglucosaminyl deacetylase
MQIDDISSIQPGYDILVFGAHPDDAEMAIGGTLLKLTAEGKKVLNVVFTTGDKGRHGTVSERIDEQRRAADFGGYDFLFLDRPDCGIYVDEKNRLDAIRVIRRARPSLLLAPYHTNFQGHRDGVNHEDHLALGKVVTGAVKVAGVGKVIPELEPWVVDRLLYFMVPRFARPSLVVDVTSQEERFKELIACFTTQMRIVRAGRPILDVLLDWRKMFGYSVGIGLGEAFLSDEPLIVESPGGLCGRVLLPGGGER